MGSKITKRISTNLASKNPSLKGGNNVNNPKKSKENRGDV